MLTITKACLCFIGLLLLNSCTATKEKPVVKNGDVEIAYQVSGSADTAVVLVHGWCINKEYWKETQEKLSQRYKVVALDLGGHGQSGKNRTQWTIEEYAKDVIAVIETLQLQKVILVGHSMSGDVVLETATMIPDKVVGLVGIDNFKEILEHFTPEQEKQIADFMKALRTNFVTKATEYGRATLFPLNYSDTVSVNRVLRDIARSDSIVATESLEKLMRYSLTEPKKLATIKVPLNLLVSDYTPTNDSTLKRYVKSGYSVETIKGTGHYPMIEKPEEFTQLLQQILASISQ